MKCSLCGREFNEQEAESGCKGCGIIKKCDLVKCPNCNFEMVPDHPPLPPLPKGGMMGDLLKKIRR